MNGILEILTNKEWMIQQEFLHSILPTLQYNLTNHSTLGIDRDKRQPMAISQSGADLIREYQVTEDGEVKPVYDAWGEGDVLGKMKEPFVNVMPVDGPITRNGGACSYGSKDIRDWMMKAADNKNCRGHVLQVNTPGGSAWAKNDFQQGIDYAHARGQRVVAFIDGLCASAGMYLASLCDEVYVMHPQDQLGCVGVMAAFYTTKNGEKNQFTGETYREYYATRSVNKNKEMRDIANDDDATLLIEELDKLEAEFRADMKAAFPKAEDEHLDGRLFPAKDVMGVLCDGQMMLGDVIAHVFGLADGTVKPVERTASRKVAKLRNTDRKPQATYQGAQATVTGGSPSGAQANIISPLNNSTNMKENYPAVFALLGVEEMQLSEEGTFFNKSLLETLNARIAEMQQAEADLKAQAEKLTADHQQAIDALKADHQAEVDALNKAHEQALAERDATIAEKQAALDTAATANADLLAQKDEDLKAKADELEAKNAELMTLTEQAGKATERITALEADLTGAQAALQTAQDTIAERDQQVSDLTAQIDELKQEPGAEPEAGASPQTNGGQAEQMGVVATTPVAQKGMSIEEMHAVWDSQK